MFFVGCPPNILSSGISFYLFSLTGTFGRASFGPLGTVSTLDVAKLRVLENKLEEMSSIRKVIKTAGYHLRNICIFKEVP